MIRRPTISSARSSRKRALRVPTVLRTILLTAFLATATHLSFIGDASAIVIDLALAFDGEARDNAAADGVFDSVSTGFPTADARVQNPTVPTSSIEDRIIIEFDLAGLSGVSSIGSATLILAETHDAGAPLGLYGGVGDGVASTTDAEITNFVTGATGAFGDSVVNTASVDVTAFIAGLFLASDSFALFAIRGAGVFPDLHYRILTSEGGTAPILRIDGKEVPEPTSVGLMALGLAACRVARRRRPRYGVAGGGL
jgi:hypothetical protein